MKTVTSTRNLSCVGIYVQPAADGSFELRRQGTVLATVSAEAFAEMVSKGHAIVEPAVSWTHDFVMSGRVTYGGGGPKVFRCDVNVAEDNVSLVPESSESNDVLLFNEWSGWMSNNRTCTPAEGATVFSRAEDSHWKRYFQLVRMTPASTLKFRQDVTRSVPQGRFRRDKLVKENVEAGETRLSDDGSTINF